VTVKLLVFPDISVGPENEGTLSVPFFVKFTSLAAAMLAALVDALPDLVKGKARRRFKDPTKWGVTGAKDPRLAGFTFGNFKTDVRKAGETILINYMCKHSTSRDKDIKNDFSIALAVAAPGTGKTRLLDDMLRVPLRSTEFEHILRLGISFNGKTGSHCRFNLASRVIREFFCGPPVHGDDDVLKEIDKLVCKFFDDRDPTSLFSDSCRQLLLLCAVEALFVKQRGASLDQCRTVLLVDEVACSGSEDDVYEIVKSFVDDGQVPRLSSDGKSQSRRGAFFTGLYITSPWRKVSPGSGRTTVQVPLGTFDVWVPDVRAAITAYAKELWPNLGAIPERAWSLLAVTGGRPRDVVIMLDHIKSSHPENTIVTANERLLLNALLDFAPWNETFARYLLPSLLSVEFCAFKNNTLTAFGADAPSPALLNADKLANLSDVVSGVPAISLRFARSMPYGLPALRLMVDALVTATNFCELDGSGKDFERVWIGLQLLHLLLQHAVRMTVKVKVDAALSREFTEVAVAPAGGRLPEPNHVFWPIDRVMHATNEDDFPLPTTEDSIDVFAPDAHQLRRINALFPSPNEKRVHVAAGASIHRMVSLRAPSLAVWHDLHGARGAVCWRVRTRQEGRRGEPAAERRGAARDLRGDGARRRVGSRLVWWTLVPVSQRTRVHDRRVRRRDAGESVSRVRRGDRRRAPPIGRGQRGGKRVCAYAELKRETNGKRSIEKEKN